jgi:hypothetical protein
MPGWNRPRPIISALYHFNTFRVILSRFPADKQITVFFPINGFFAGNRYSWNNHMVNGLVVPFLLRKTYVILLCFMLLLPCGFLDSKAGFQPLFHSF